MKYLIVLISLFYIVKYSSADITTEEASKIVKAASGRCLQKFTLTDDEASKLKSLQLQTSRNGKCFQACLMKEISLLSSSNKPKKDGFIIAVGVLHPNESSKQKLADRIYKSCSKLTDPDECEAAAKIGACIFKVRKTKSS